MTQANDFLRGLIEEQPFPTSRGVMPDKFRRIIASRTYNSATAAWLAYARSAEDVEECDWYMESLYQTRGGAFFLIGEGMERTPWRYWDASRNEACRGHGLLPLNESQARRWLELRGLADEYEEIFGGAKEAEAEAMLLRLPPIIMRQVVAASSAQGVSSHAWVTSAVTQALQHARNS